MDNKKDEKMMWDNDKNDLIKFVNENHEKLESANGM